MVAGSDQPAEAVAEVGDEVGQNVVAVRPNFVAVRPSLVAVRPMGHEHVHRNGSFTV